MPELENFSFTVVVTAPTLDDAKTVMAERLNHDEDYGFEYVILYVETKELESDVNPD